MRKKTVYFYVFFFPALFTRRLFRPQIRADDSEGVAKAWSFKYKMKRQESFIMLLLLKQMGEDTTRPSRLQQKCFLNETVLSTWDTDMLHHS